MVLYACHPFFGFQSFKYHKGYRLKSWSTRRRDLDLKYFIHSAGMMAINWSFTKGKEDIENQEIQTRSCRPA